MVGQLADTEPDVPTLEQFLNDGSNLSTVPDLENYARCIGIGYLNQTQEERLSAAVGMWFLAEMEIPRSDGRVGCG